MNRSQLKGKASEFLSGGRYIKALLISFLYSLLALGQFLYVDPDQARYYISLKSFNYLKEYLGLNIFNPLLEISAEQFLALSILSLLVIVFILPILRLSINKFYMGKGAKDSQEDGDFKLIAKEYRGKIIVLSLIKNIKLIVWTLLLIVPGIIKSFEYIFVDYIMADDPSLSIDQVFQMSKEMTDGNKMDIFVLLMSFFGWYFLAYFLPGANYLVNPYKEATMAQAYIYYRDQYQISNIKDYRETY